MFDQCRRSRLRALEVLAATAALGCVAILAARILGAISLKVPLQTTTSGGEEESLFAIWKYVHSMPVYTALRRIPFSWSVFNWLFYASYGSVVRIFGLPDPWLPTICRLLTLAGALCATGLAYVTFRQLCGHAGRIAIASLAVLIALGPLPGFWSITTRPDIWALALEIGLVLAFLSLAPKHPRIAAILVSVMAYLAWSLKQTNVIALATIVCFLALRRRWKDLSIIVLLACGGIGITLLLGPEDYVRNVLHADYIWSMVPRHALDVAVKAACKIPAILLPCVAIAALAARDRGFLRRFWIDDHLLLASCGVVLGSGFVLVESTHLQAADNYWIPVAYFGCFWAVTSTKFVATGSHRVGPMLHAWRLGWLLQVASLLILGSGHAGRISVRSADTRIVATQPCLNRLPRPIFVEDTSTALPWITPTAQPFVVASGYPILRQHGRPVERNGIGGLIDEGHFASLVLADPKVHVLVPFWSTPGFFDRGDLSRHYVEADGCGEMKVYLRKSP